MTKSKISDKFFEKILSKLKIAIQEEDPEKFKKWNLLLLPLKSEKRAVRLFKETANTFIKKSSNLFNEKFFKFFIIETQIHKLNNAEFIHASVCNLNIKSYEILKEINGEKFYDNSFFNKKTFELFNSMGFENDFERILTFSSPYTVEQYLKDFHLNPFNVELSHKMFSTIDVDRRKNILIDNLYRCIDENKIEKIEYLFNYLKSESVSSNTIELEIKEKLRLHNLRKSLSSVLENILSKEKTIGQLYFEKFLYHYQLEEKLELVHEKQNSRKMKI